MIGRITNGYTTRDANIPVNKAVLVDEDSSSITAVSKEFLPDSEMSLVNSFDRGIPLFQPFGKKNSSNGILYDSYALHRVNILH